MSGLWAAGPSRLERHVPWIRTTRRGTRAPAVTRVFKPARTVLPGLDSQTPVPPAHRGGRLQYHERTVHCSSTVTTQSSGLIRNLRGRISQRSDISEVGYLCARYQVSSEHEFRVKRKSPESRDITGFGLCSLLDSKNLLPNHFNIIHSNASHTNTMERDRACEHGQMLIATH